MAKIEERMQGELTDLLNLIRRMGGGVVFEEFPGAFEEDTDAPAAHAVNAARAHRRSYSRVKGVPLIAKPEKCREGREVGDPDATEGRDGTQAAC
jgi:hypothetical protein